MTESEQIEGLKNEGFTDLRVVPFLVQTDFPEHTHTDYTVHVILKGELLLIESSGTKSLKEGERFEIPAGTTHTAKTGPEGCTFIVGVKK